MTMIEQARTCVALALLCCGAMRAADEETAAEIAKYLVRKTRNAVQVDGRLSPGEWDRAETVKLQFWWPEQTGPKQETLVRLLWSEQALYVSYNCRDTDITAVHGERDDPTYRDDCCEVFLQPAPRHRPTAYVGLEINARAVLYDYFCAHRVALVKRFDLRGCNCMASLDGTLNARGDTDNGWVLEVAIPFDNFDCLTKNTPPRIGDTWRCQLCRWDGVKPDRALSLWTDSRPKHPSPHKPERFGVLQFGE